MLNHKILNHEKTKYLTVKVEYYLFIWARIKYWIIEYERTNANLLSIRELNIPGLLLRIKHYFFKYQGIKH